MIVIVFFLLTLTLMPGAALAGVSDFTPGQRYELNLYQSSSLEDNGGTASEIDVPSTGLFPQAVIEIFSCPAPASQQSSEAGYQATLTLYDTNNGTYRLSGFFYPDSRYFEFSASLFGNSELACQFTVKGNAATYYPPNSPPQGVLGVSFTYEGCWRLMEDFLVTSTSPLGSADTCQGPEACTPEKVYLYVDKLSCWVELEGCPEYVSQAFPEAGLIIPSRDGEAEIPERDELCSSPESCPETTPASEDPCLAVWDEEEQILHIPCIDIGLGEIYWADFGGTCDNKFEFKEVGRVSP